MNKKTIVSLLVLALVAVACATDTTEDAAVEVVVEKTTLETVTDRGFLKCGVSGSAVAFSETQADGSVTGIDADYCYAVAAAVFGDYSKVEFTVDVDSSGLSKREWNELMIAFDLKDKLI